MQIGPTLRVVYAALAIVGAASSASAQLSNKEAPIVVGHFHMNATNVAEHRKFWVDTLGGTADKIGSAAVVRFPGIVLFFDQKKPSGPNRGTAFDHIGFAVPDVPALTTRIVAAGYALTVGREPVPGRRRGRRPGASLLHRFRKRQIGWAPAMPTSTNRPVCSTIPARVIASRSPSFSE